MNCKKNEKKKWPHRIGAKYFIIGVNSQKITVSKC